MTAKEIQEARERWQNWQPIFSREMRREDAEALADAYCELLDETPIDEEWASKEISHIHGRLLEPSDYGWYIEFGHVTAHIQTRGQLRALLMTMGVTHD